MANHIIIGVDLSNKNDIGTMVVRRIRNDQSIDIVDVFQGDEARELYEKLIANKSSLTLQKTEAGTTEVKIKSLGTNCSEALFFYISRNFQFLL